MPLDLQLKDSIVKQLIFILFLSLYLYPATGFCGQVNAFIYHRFDEERYPSTNIASDVFRQQLDYLKEHQVEVISLPEIAERLAGAQPLPKHAAALCVDDAYRSFYDVAMPILRSYGYPVTLFVNTDAVGTSGYMTWDELKNLVAEGVVIGNHTASHAYLVEARPGETYAEWRARIRTDILKAQDAFKEHLRISPKLFAYTYGEYSAEVVDIVKELGFSAAFAQQSGVIHDQHDAFILPRFPMGGPFATLKGFVNKLNMHPLVIMDQEPFDPVVVDSPPTLYVQLGDDSIDPQRFNCFVQGDNHCVVERAKEKGAGWYQITADEPLSGRRNKYTLTVQQKDNTWLWFSHPWINADNPPRLMP